MAYRRDAPVRADSRPNKNGGSASGDRGGVQEDLDQVVLFAGAAAASRRVRLLGEHGGRPQLQR